MNAKTISPKLRFILADGQGRVIIKYLGENDIGCDVTASADGIEALKGTKPVTIFIKEIGTFCVEYYTESLEKPYSGKVAIVTGSAQGFGLGIAEYLASKGAAVVVADMNEEGAAKAAEDIAEKFGVKTVSVTTNVSDEASVENLIDTTVASLGGLDIFVNNAGIVRAGSLDEMTLRDFTLVENVNYNAYFLCAKYASKVMKLQRGINPEIMSDIIEINSKSGLEGSNKNFAYAGSKFGGIGLTQSFAMELAPFGIKVNAVCPGNFLDGPLWSDPEKGLFVQYLNAGKVPGAKTVEDVRKFYEAKVPLGRGCRTEDVCLAISYIISQKYETGQAIPVTGGQVMLK